MKKLIVSVVAIILLAACENPVQMETKVFEDGSLGKKLVIEKIDSATHLKNVFGVSVGKGWGFQVDSMRVIFNKTDSAKRYALKGDPKQNVKGEPKTLIHLFKNFPSAAAANKELNSGIDSVFNIESTFEKNFRWFYTYIRYSETFKPINRFQKINPKDYFTTEDSLFINRLPGEGTAVPKADSLFLETLNKKIFETFAEDALYNEFYRIIETVVMKHTGETKWLDSIRGSKEEIYKMLDDLNTDISALDFAATVSKKIGIPLPQEANADFRLASKNLSNRIGFMSYARDGKYTNAIEMPWRVVDSNADSVVANKLYFRPLATKFAIQPYTMYAVSRKLNIWAVAVSGLLVVLTLFVLFKARARS